MGNKEKNFVSAVIYVHNAAAGIKGFLEQVGNVLEENFERSEMIFVDDCSDDNSVSIIRECGSGLHTSSITILHLSFFHGIEASMSAGVDLSIGDFVLEFDSVWQDYDSAEIMRVYQKALEGFDIVSASPERKQKATSSLFYQVFNKSAHLPYELYTECFRILSRRAVNRVSSMNQYVPYRKAVYANCGLGICNLRYPVAMDSVKAADREEGRYRRGLAAEALILFTQAGYRVAVCLTALMMCAAIGMTGYTVFVYTARRPVEGWTTTLLFMSIAFLGLFGILTIIVKYLQIIVDLVFRKRGCTFGEIEKL